MDRRTFLIFLAVGLLSGKAVFSHADFAMESEDRIINRFLLHLLGIEDKDIDIYSRLKNRVSRGRGMQYKTILRELELYRKDGDIDLNLFFSDLEARRIKNPVIYPMVESAKIDAATVFYTSKDGWLLAGYDGPPLKGYQDYSVCR